MDKRAANPQEESWTDLQRGLILKAALVMAVAAWYAWCVELSRRMPNLGLILLMVVGAAACLGPATVRWLPPHLAALSQVLASFLGVYVTYAVLGYTEAAPFFVIPVLLAAILLTPWSAPPVALAAIVVLSANPRLAATTLWANRLFLAIVGVVAALAAADLRAALRHAWAYTARTASLTREVQARQEEVNRLNQQLQLANYLLKRSNYELALARQEAEEARHAKERFATSVSHELRTPLSIILGFTEVMQRFPEVYGAVQWSPLLRQDIAEVQRSARYLADLVDDVLDLARVEALQMPIRREWVDLASLLADSVEVAKRLVTNKPVELKLECIGELPQLFIDRTRIRQVLLNLLANASRFTEQGSITVGAYEAAQDVIAFVKDTGPGIPPQRLGDIFKEWRQVEQGTLSSASQGKGLGLTIAKRFVQLHGGRIWVESKLGQGSAFYFALPISPKQVSASVIPSPGILPISPDKPSLVVIDRDASAAAYLTRWLEHFTVWPAADVAEAKALVHSRHPLAVLVNLPPARQFDGYANGIVNDLDTSVPVIRCTLPFGDWLLDGQLFEAWLVKPVSAAQLGEALRKLGDWQKVLIVDDDRAFAQLMFRLLRALKEDCQVTWASTAGDALARLGEQEWDVLLVDIALPDMDGRGLARLARKSYDGHNLHVLAVSGLQPGEERDQPVGTSFTLTKRAGLREGELLALLKSVLEAVVPSYQDRGPSSEPLAAVGERPA
ncbi:MAG: ATP-binding protein [Anaerolineae bacterium]